MSATRVTMGSNGRLVIPAALRKEIGLHDGNTVLLEVKGGELRLRRLKDAVEDAQSRLRPFLDGSPSLAKDLIEDRRKEQSQ